MATSLYVLFNNNNSDLIVWEERHSTAFRGLKQSLMNSSAFGLPMIRLFFFSFLYMKGREYPWVTHPKIPLTHSILQTSSWTLCHRDIPPCLRIITTIAPLVKANQKIIVGATLTIFVPHPVESLLNSHHTQHFSVSCITFMKSICYLLLM